MNPWEERVQNSPAKAYAEELKRLIASLKLAEYDINIRESLMRVGVVADTVLNKINNSDPRLISAPALANIGNSITNVATYVNNWLVGQGDSFITSSAQTELDSVVSQLPQLSPDQDVPEARETITRLRRSVAGNITAADKLIEQLKQRGTQADTTIDEKVQLAKQDFDSLQQEIEKLDADLKSIRSSSATVSTEQTTAFTKAEADRSSKFTDFLDNNQSRLNSKLEDLETAATKSVGTIKKKVNDDLSSVEQSKSEVERLLNIVGEEALIGDYSKTGRQEMRFAEAWAIGAFFSILGAIVFAIDFAKNVSNQLSASQAISWQYMVAKILLILSFGALAGYATTQSSEHRAAQRDSETMALQFSAITPYLRNITDTALREKLIVTLAEKLFGPRRALKRNKKENNPIVLSQLAEALLEAVKQLKK